jgi:glycosyltransferase involved in cell wall biosynthesis
MSVSIIIPCRHERFLIPTVNNLLTKADGEIEVIVTLDGYTDAEVAALYQAEVPLTTDSRVTLVVKPLAVGMREAINAAAAVATGDYLMKIDGHVLMAQGFDTVLIADIEPNWVVVPRRYALDPIAWCIAADRPHIDYHYLSWPYIDPAHVGLHGRWWRERQHARADVLVDDDMSSQGSCWFMHTSHWTDRLQGLSTDGYGDFIQEYQEIGGKTWLGGGACKTNKRTWYAHLHKGKTYGRGYKVSRSSWERGVQYSADLWMNNRWPDRVHDIDWLIEKFWPIPTWPDDWRTHDFSDLVR